MIRLEHLNVSVTDIELTLGFYQAAFPHWKIRQEGSHVWENKDSKWLHFGDDYTYITFNNSDPSDANKTHSRLSGLGHFAFEVTDLDALIKRMRTAGFLPHNYGASNPYRKNQYFMDPNGFEVEFVEYLSDLPELRNS